MKEKITKEQKDWIKAWHEYIDYIHASGIRGTYAQYEKLKEQLTEIKETISKIGSCR